jgi:hypothetical protein
MKELLGGICSKVQPYFSSGESIVGTISIICMISVVVNIIAFCGSCCIKMKGKAKDNYVVLEKSEEVKDETAEDKDKKEEEGDKKEGEEGDKKEGEEGDKKEEAKDAKEEDGDK